VTPPRKKSKLTIWKNLKVTQMARTVTFHRCMGSAELCLSRTQHPILHLRTGDVPRHELQLPIFHSRVASAPTSTGSSTESLQQKHFFSIVEKNSENFFESFWKVFGKFLESFWKVAHPPRFDRGFR
jgi:hypothetical protein